LSSRLFLQNAVRIAEPMAGQYKRWIMWGLAVRIKSIASLLFLFLPAIVSAPLGFILRAIEHTNRPAISIIVNEKLLNKENQKPELSKEKPLHLSIHNIASVPTFFSTLLDLRDPVTRAWEIAFSITSDLKHQPDIICYQEAFHEDATKIICKEL